jgi:hypothetical protein
MVLSSGGTRNNDFYGIPRPEMESSKTDTDRYAESEHTVTIRGR